MKKALFLFAILALCGCGRSTPTNYYLLESMTPAIQADSLPKTTLRVAQVSTADYLNRNNIISRVQDQTKLIVAEFHLWVEPVASGVRRVVEEVLAEPLRQNGICLLPSATEERGTHVLLLDVQRLDGNFNENAVLECWWTLLDRSDSPVARGKFVADELVAGADYNILVKTESLLVRKMAEFLAGQLPKYIRTR